MTPLISADESNIEEKKKDGGRVIPGTIRQAIHEINLKKIKIKTRQIKRDCLNR
jgi:hypothetical protein